jgi:peptide/nickel transport system substrate-binding protein
VDAEESGFDPTQARFDEVGVMYARTVFDPLTIILANGDWGPYLAESVIPNSEYTAWTVTLRPNVVFHDGTPCNGAALLTNFVAQSKSLLTGVVLSPTLVSITQTGPLAVTITFKEPWVPFPFYLAGGIGGQIAYIAAPSMLSNPDGTSHPVGTGPFVFKEWVPNDHFTATANPNYWRKGMPYLSQITYKPIPDESARAEALKSGTIDLMITDTPQIITQFRGNHSYAYIDDSTHVAGEPDMNCVQLNCLAKPFNDPNVRLAAAMAVNRQQYAKVIDEGVLPVSNGLFVPGSPYYSSTKYPKYNPSQAAKLVKAAEKTAGGPISFSYGSTNSPAAIRAAQYLEQAWGQVGMQVKTNIVQQNDTINNALAGKYQALGWRQFGAVDPDLNYIFWSTTTVSSGALSINMARNADPTIEKALLTGRSETDKSVRETAYQTVNKRLALDLPYLWTDRAVWAVIGDTNVQNFNNPTAPNGQMAFGMIGGSVWPTQIWIS